MGQTIAEKVFSRHAGRPVGAGEIVFVPVDLMMSNDASFPLVLEALQKIPGYTLRKPEKLVLIPDHYCPSPSPEVVAIHETLREFSRKHACLLYPGGEGICHQIIPEKGHVSPGRLVIGTDSHTTTYGALNAFATGVGSTDMALAIHYDLLWFRVPESLKIELLGTIPKGVYAKDIILSIVARVTARGATYQSIEFSGPALEGITMEGRLTVCNMAVEMGAKAGIMPGDDVCLSWLKEKGIPDAEPIAPDADASYASVISIDVSGLEPQVACPHRVDNVRPVSEVRGTPLRMAFLGTCTNGRLEDLSLAARVLGGRKIHPDMTLVVSPASREVLLEAMKTGVVQSLVASGAMVNPPGCGPCIGTLGGIPGEGMNVISTANRNFLGRMGTTKASIYLASPATLAASCLTAEITDPRPCL
jgi:3-isopropylmalate/(R)-2-methylmalate dehydratase large subunit